MTIEEFAGSYLLPIAAASFIAWLVHRLGRVFVRRFVRLGDIAPVSMRLREERRRTLQDLFASMVSFTAFLGAIIFSLALFVDADTLVWLVGLFSAGIGFGARPLISDWLTGIGFIFEDTFGIGEKVEIMGVEGVIEQINLRTTTLRAPNGELYVIPNGEIRVIRNFSRAQYSTANITVKMQAADAGRAIDELEALGAEMARAEVDLLEPWQVISSTGEVSQCIELMLLIRVRFGKAAQLRPRLQARIQSRLAEAGIALAE